MTEQSIIEFDKVDFEINNISILKDVSFTIKDRKLAFIVGPNGGGKTTLLRLILGLLKPTAGKIRVFGKSPEIARKRIGYTPQHMQFDPQFPVTVMNVVLMGRLGDTKGWRYNARDREIALNALDDLGIGDLGNRLFSDLSGGQRQRVLIARALASNPDILLLDEPTANVDAETETRLFEIVKNLRDRMTVLMVSHDFGFVSETVDCAICVNRRVFMHPTSQISSETLKNLYGEDMRLIRHDLTVEHGKAE